MYSKIKEKKEWWKEAIVYQIYPRSFKDSNGDGIGDIKGIISKLDYLEKLGITVIWLNPIFSSPNDDMGYDVSDYKNIMPEMGTMEDFEELLKGLHARGIKLIVDLVLNHTSDEHEWFKQSRSSRNNVYRNYYHWWPAENGVPPKRFSLFHEEGAWTYDALTNSYYLHYFSRKQPDLNWDNATVRKEMYSMMRFWLDKGVNGFRLDAFTFISKDTNFPIISEKYESDFINYYASGPLLHNYIQEMNLEVFSKYDIMTVGEASGIAPEQALLFTAAERKELQTLYHFDHANWGRDKNNLYYPDATNRKLSDLKKVFTKWNDVFKTDGWGTTYFTTHDQSRMVSRFGNDTVYRKESSKLLFTFLLSMRGIPYIYQGDEIGMNNIRFDNIEDYRDIHTINYYKHLAATGQNTEAFINAQKEVSRENSRTPIQWNNSLNAGFTNGTPWLKINPNYNEINVALAEENPDSILHYVRKMIALRKATPTLVYGDYELLAEEDEKIFAFTRSFDNEKIVTVLNFSDEKNEFIFPFNINNVTELINNYNTTSTLSNNRLCLQPWQAVILKLN
ncbi:MAG: alpha-glucosidase [Bacteroidetes bacterium]|nr:alpha-glucosidase [Bacteroidota bacterium]MBS1649037.1 alpha-glucosidase [Bacteroidota bacterium]